MHLDDDSVGGGVLQPGIPARHKGEGPTGWSNDSRLQLGMAEMLSSVAGMEALMGLPFILRSCAEGDEATGAALPPNLKMVITEYNVMERAGPFKLSWAHALFIASAALNLLAVDAVDSVMLHVLLNGFGWGALYETTNDFTSAGVAPRGSSATGIGKDGCLLAECMSLRTEPYAPTAVGSALAALAAAMSGASRATEVSANRTLFPTNPQLCGGLKPDGMAGTVCYPSLLAWRFSGAAASSNVAVLNLSPTALRYAGAGESYRTWSSPAAGGRPSRLCSSPNPACGMAVRPARLLRWEWLLRVCIAQTGVGLYRHAGAVDRWGHRGHRARAAAVHHHDVVQREVISVSLFCGGAHPSVLPVRHCRRATGVSADSLPVPGEKSSPRPSASSAPRFQLCFVPPGDRTLGLVAGGVRTLTAARRAAVGRVVPSIRGVDDHFCRRSSSAVAASRAAKAAAATSASESLGASVPSSSAFSRRASSFSTSQMSWRSCSLHASSAWFASGPPALRRASVSCFVASAARRLRAIASPSALTTATRLAAQPILSAAPPLSAALPASLLRCRVSSCASRRRATARPIWLPASARSRPRPRLFDSDQESSARRRWRLRLAARSVVCRYVGRQTQSFRVVNCASDAALPR